MGAAELRERPVVAEPEPRSERAQDPRRLGLKRYEHTSGQPVELLGGHRRTSASSARTR